MKQNWSKVFDIAIDWEVQIYGKIPVFPAFWGNLTWHCRDVGDGLFAEGGEEGLEEGEGFVGEEAALHFGGGVEYGAVGAG